MSDPSVPFRDFEHHGWQNVASQYGPGFGSVTTQSIEPLLDAAGIGTSAAKVHLLDIASGPGYVAAAAARRGCVVTGVDFSSEVVTIARRSNPGLEFCEGDAEALNFPDCAFDAVVMNFGMLHLGRPERAIAEAYRVLKPGGRYAFTVWDVPARAIAFDIVLQAIQTYGNMDVGLPEGPPFFRFSDPDEGRRVLAATGFAEIRSVQIPQVWRLESGDALFSTMRTAAVRTAALLNLQSASALQSIQAAIVERAETFRKGSFIELSMPAILTSGIK